jgi:hypothetical protein
MYSNEQDDNKTQPRTPQPDPVISSGADSYVEKNPDEWITGTEPKTDAQKSTTSDETGKSSRENLKAKDSPTTDEKTSGSNAEKDPDEWITGSEPMTGAQKSYLKTLSDEAGEPFNENLSKAEASKRINELQHKTGRGLNNAQDSNL